MALTKIPASLLDTSGGLDLQGNITLGDTEELHLGSDNDFKIYHNGLNAVIKTDTGDIRYQSNSRHVFCDVGFNENHAIFNDNGAVNLYYDNQLKIATSSSGATVTGDLAVTGDLNITGNVNSASVTDLDVTDKTITLGAGQTEALSGGSGIIVDGSSASLLWDEATTTWDLNNALNIDSPLDASITLNKTSGSTWNYLQFVNQGTRNFYVGVDVGSDFVFGADNSGDFYFTGGNVGVNESSPNGYLHVTGKASYTTANSGEVSGLGFVRFQPNNNSEHSLWFHNANNNLGISGYTDAATTSTRDITLQTYGGRVGIGTASPASLVHASLGNVAFGFDSGFYVSANPSDYTVGRGAGITIQNADVITGGVYGIRETNGWSGALTFYTHTSTSGNTFDTTFTEKMRIGNDGKVGIGTESPSSLLHLADTTNPIQIRLEPQGQANYPKLVGASAAGTNDTYFAVDFVTRGEALRIDGETGNVGVGTDNPVGNLHVVGASGSAGRIYLSDADNGTAAGDSLLITKSGTSASVYNRDSGSLNLGTNDDNDMVVINSSGQVGIGTTSPVYSIHTSDTLDNSNPNKRRILIESTNNGSNMGYMWNGPSSNGTARAGGIYYQPGDTDATSYVGITATNSDYQMVITRDGNVGIGEDAPTVKLEVNGQRNDTVTPANATAKFYGYTNGDGLAIGSYLSSPYGSYLQAGYLLDTYATPYNGGYPIALNPIGGNVGIGYSAPTNTLQIGDSGHTGYSIATASDTYGAIIQVGKAATPASSAALWVRNLNNGGTVTEILRANANGKVLIGDIQDPVDDLLQIETPASGGGHGIHIRRNDSNADQGIGRIMFGNNTDTDLASIYVKTDGSTDNAAMTFNTQPNGGAITERMRIHSGGDITMGSSTSTDNMRHEFTSKGRHVSKIQTSFYIGSDDWRDSEMLKGTGNHPTGYYNSGTPYNASTIKGVEFGNAGWYPHVFIPFDSSMKYRLSAVVHQRVGNGVMYIGLICADENFNTLFTDGINSYNYLLASNYSVTAGNTYTFDKTIQGYNVPNGTDSTKVDPGTVYIRPLILFNYQGASSNRTVVKSFNILPGSSSAAI